MRSGSGEGGDFFLGNVAQELGRTARPHLPTLHPLARRDQGTGGDHRAAFDHRPIEYLRPHADEAIILYGAAMDDAAMADGYVRTDIGSELTAGDMDNGSVLNIGPLADADFMNVAANHHPIPQAGACPDHHIADNRRGMGDEDIGGDLRRMAAKIQDQSSHRILTEKAVAA